MQMLHPHECHSLRQDGIFGINGHQKGDGHRIDDDNECSQDSGCRRQKSCDLCSSAGRREVVYMTAEEERDRYESNIECDGEQHNRDLQRAHIGAEGYEQSQRFVCYPSRTYHEDYRGDCWALIFTCHVARRWNQGHAHAAESSTFRIHLM